MMSNATWYQVQYDYTVVEHFAYCMRSTVQNSTRHKMEPTTMIEPQQGPIR